MAEESKEEKFTIRLHVYDREIPVKIPRRDEKICRDAANLATQKINDYFRVFGKSGEKQREEIIFMALIDIALQAIVTSNRNDTSPFTDTLKKLTSEIEDALKGSDDSLKDS
jgi:hypothetical protein